MYAPHFPIGPTIESSSFTAPLGYMANDPPKIMCTILVLYDIVNTITKVLVIQHLLENLVPNLDLDT